MPPPSTGLSAWYKADAGLYKDSGGTTPATSDGDSVIRWNDQTANANHLIAPDGTPLLKLSILNSLPVVRFTNSPSCRIVKADSSLSIGTGDYWIAIVYRTLSSFPGDGYNGIFSLGVETPGLEFPHGSHLSVYQGADHDFAATLTTNTDYITEIARVSGTRKAYHAVLGSTPTLDSNTFADTVSVGTEIELGTDGGGEYFIGDIAEVLIYSAALDSTDQASLESYLGRWVASSAPTTATLSGPTSGTVGVASTNFTITLDQAAESGGVSCVITDSVGGDTVTTSPVVISSGNTTGTFTITPSTTGDRNITLTSATKQSPQSGTLTVAGSPITYNSHEAISATGAVMLMGF